MIPAISPPQSLIASKASAPAGGDAAAFALTLTDLAVAAPTGAPERQELAVPGKAMPSEPAADPLAWLTPGEPFATPDLMPADTGHVAMPLIEAGRTDTRPFPAFDGTSRTTPAFPVIEPSANARSGVVERRLAHPSADEVEVAIPTRCAPPPDFTEAADFTASVTVDAAQSGSRTGERAEDPTAVASADPATAPVPIPPGSPPLLQPLADAQPAFRAAPDQAGIAAGPREPGVIMQAAPSARAQVDAYSTQTFVTLAALQPASGTDPEPVGPTWATPPVPGMTPAPNRTPTPGDAAASAARTPDTESMRTPSDPNPRAPDTRPTAPEARQASAFPARSPSIGPASQVFAELRRSARDVRPDPASEAALHALAVPSDTTARIASPPAQTLDLSQELWPLAMVERIERLRDAADAADTRIRLVPDALGAIDVSVTREGEAVHVHFAAEQAATRALLQDAAHRLADAAEARGLKLGQTSVGDGGADRNGRQPMPDHPLPSSPRPARPPGPAEEPDNRIA